MCPIVQNITAGYYYVTDELASPVTKGWFLIGNPLGLAFILFTYQYFCRHLGPRLMKDREPFNLTNIITIYNAIQVLLNIYMVGQAIRYVVYYNYNFQCQALETIPYNATEVAKCIYVYYIIKITDLLDTVFFVLRKSNRQITPLHLHHHTLMPITTWFMATYHPGGQCVLVGSLNSLVHIIMYSYYLAAGLGKDYKKYLWWKKYVTILQLTQFAVVAIHQLNSMRYDCGYPKYLQYLTLFYSAYFFNTFAQFYYHAYIKKGREKKVQKYPVKVANGNSHHIE